MIVLKILLGIFLIVFGFFAAVSVFYLWVKTVATISYLLDFLEKK